MLTLFQSIITLLSGGFFWEIIKFFQPDINRVFKQQRDAKTTFYQSIDPILKSCNELYGKLLSLSKEDFATFNNQQNSNSLNPEINRLYVYYLFAQFWANIEYVRLENQYESLIKIKKGHELLKFIETLESRKYRVLDRSIQRIIGENLLISKEQKFRVMTLHEFVENVNDKSSSLSRWVKFFEVEFSKIKFNETRQRILVYGIIVSIMIDHFDPNHKIIRKRPYYTNKLTL